MSGKLGDGQGGDGDYGDGGGGRGGGLVLTVRAQEMWGVGGDDDGRG